MTRRSLRAVQGAALVATAAMAVSACSSSAKPAAAKVTSNFTYGSIPAQNTNATTGGTVNIAEDPGAGPNWIFPITPAANSSVYDFYQFEQLSWRPVYWAPKGSVQDYDWSKSMSDAAPTVSADGKTFTIKLNGKYTWPDGSKVSAQDILLYLDLDKAAVKENPANNGNYSPGQFPDNVTAATAVDDQTVNLTFDKAYNPAWVLGTQFNQIVPLPSKSWAKSSTSGAMLDFSQPANAKAIYDYLAAQSKDLSTYATNPLWQVVDGPFKISAYNPSTQADSFLTNKAFNATGTTKIDGINQIAYTSPTAEFNDLQTGKLDVGFIKSDNMPQISKLTAKGMNTYGEPAAGFYDLVFNFQDGAFGKAISNLYIRQAFAHLQDQDAEIKGIWEGAAAPAYGPNAVAPASPFTPDSAKTNPWPFSVDAASKLLSDHGWTVVPNGETTCTNPGTADNQCGPGVVKGQNLDFVWYYVSSPKSAGQVVTTFAANLKKIGITATLKTDTFNNIITNQSDVSSPKTATTWGMADWGGNSANVYPSTNTLFNTGGSFNAGGFTDKTIDGLINNSMLSTDPTALTKELAAVGTALPVLWEPNEDQIYAWNKKLDGPRNSFTTLTQFYLNPEDWYFTK